MDAPRAQPAGAPAQVRAGRRRHRHRRRRPDCSPIVLDELELRPAAAAVRAPHAAVRVDDRARGPLAHRGGRAGRHRPARRHVGRRGPALRRRPLGVRGDRSATAGASWRASAAACSTRPTWSRSRPTPACSSCSARPCSSVTRLFTSIGHHRVVRLPVDVPPQRPGPARPAAAVPAGHRLAGPRRPARAGRALAQPRAGRGHAGRAGDPRRARASTSTAPSPRPTCR